MHYNIVTVRNRWSSSGLLNELFTPKQEVELCRYLESAMDTLLAMDGDDELPDNVGDFVITSIVELYEMLTIRRFHPSEVKQKILADNLRMNEHKLDIDKIIEISEKVMVEDYVSANDVFKQSNIDFKVRAKVCSNYLVEYGRGK